MAGLLDYYNQNPELWEENKHLVAKDPAYDLGLMDLGAMSFKERFGGAYPKADWISKGLRSLGWMDPAEYRPKSRVLGSYLHSEADPIRRYKDAGIEPGDISLFTEPFTEGDTPTYWTDPNLVPPSERWNEPLSNVDKARVIAHENRHKLTEENPELYDLQPRWSGIEEGFNRQPGGFKKMGNEYWRNEAFNRFMDYRNFPDVQFRGKTRGWYPRGMSSPNLKPTDMYLDKIWKDHWEPSAKAYDEKLKEISKRQRKNVPGTPIVPTGGNGGYQGGGGKPGSMPTGTAGRNPWGRADGGLINLYRNGGFI